MFLWNYKCALTNAVAQNLKFCLMVLNASDIMVFWCQLKSQK